MADNTEALPKLRNARACESCRASKSRCVYKTEPGVCQKCEESGNQCIVRTKARPMRTQARRPSSTSNENHSPGSSKLKVLMNLPAVPSPDKRGDIEQLHQHHEHIFSGGDRMESPAANSLEYSMQKVPASQPLIQQRKVTLSEAEKLLLSFKERAPFFPFVEVPSEEKISTLSRRSPFLLLAILTAASISEPSLHHQMDYEFRRVLSLKVIVEGQKSLDFLQGLLVYIAWYPIHTSPKSNQSFLYMNLAISLIVDLGLDNAVPNPMHFNAISTQDLIEGGLFTKASKRAYLGTYYLSSVLSMGFQKGNNLHYCNLMDSRGEELLRDETSGDIHSLVRLQRLCERIGEFYSAKDREQEVHMQSLTAEMTAQGFLNELEEWKCSTSDAIRSTAFVGVSERFAHISIHSHRLGFLRRPYNLILRTKNKELASESQLTGCLEACKAFFEYLLSLSQASFCKFGIAQWAEIVQAILVLTRLTFRMAADLGWDADTTRTNVPLVMYLDCLCYRFQQLSSTPSDARHPQNNPDAFCMLKMILASLKRSYEQRVGDVKPSSSNFEYENVMGVSTGYCPMHDPSLSVYFDAVFSLTEGSLDQSGSLSSGSSHTAAFHDIWATMTGTWAEE